jgi:hypothetical protein
MPNFDRKIEAAWPDKECPGWMECQLECGHLTHQPKSNTNKICHCGVCMLNHEAHVRELKKFEARIAKAAAAPSTTTEEPLHG